MGRRAAKEIVRKTASGETGAHLTVPDDRLARYARWQETVAALGQIALSSGSLQELMNQAVHRLAVTLNVEYVEVLELQQDGRSLNLRAGHGWQKNSTGRVNILATPRSQPGFTLIAKEPVVLVDLATETRFASPPQLHQHGVVSGITVAIGGNPKAYGVLGVYSRSRRDFESDEVRFLRTVANVLAAAARGFESDQAHRDSAARVGAIVTTLVDGIITIDDRGVIESLNPAAEKIFGYSATEVAGHNVRMLMPRPYQDEHDGYILNYLRTGARRIIGIGREVSGLRKDGSTFPMDLAVSELEVSGRRMFTGVVRDITDRRQMEREIIEAGAAEQRRIGQDLHDGLCQHLAGIAFAIEVLSQKLIARGAPEAPGIQKIGEMVDQSITQARDLARGLQPVTLDANGLVSALKALSEKVEDMFHVSCLFVCDGPCQVPENTVATHLFRIAQEAISNAVKHGKARTIVIDLAVNDHEVSLTIKDDGIGLKRSAGKPHGMGLQTMDYRARVIGGSLRVQASDKGGTEVICVVRNKPAQVNDNDAEKVSYGKEKRGNGKAQNENSRGGRPPHRSRAPG